MSYIASARAMCAALLSLDNVLVLVCLEPISAWCSDCIGCFKLQRVYPPTRGRHNRAQAHCVWPAQAASAASAAGDKAAKAAKSGAAPTQKAANGAEREAGGTGEAASQVRLLLSAWSLAGVAQQAPRCFSGISLSLARKASLTMQNETLWLHSLFIAAVPRETTMPGNRVHVKVLGVTPRVIESGSQALFPDYLSA